jgi:hypothetical protein
MLWHLGFVCGFNKYGVWVIVVSYMGSFGQQKPAVSRYAEKLMCTAILSELLHVGRAFEGFSKVCITCHAMQDGLVHDVGNAQLTEAVYSGVE